MRRLALSLGLAVLILWNLPIDVGGQAKPSVESAGVQGATTRDVENAPVERLGVGEFLL